MRHTLLSLLLSTSFVAVLAAPAFAQSAPNTTQTDQSEEDWRKSKKKSTKDDPWDGFKNTNNWGQGSQRSMSPVDMLPEDSRRFLMKERAQRLAEAGIGEPIDTVFEPSDKAKTDPSLESDEKAAWSEMMKDMGGAGSPPAGDPNGDRNAQPNTLSGQAGSSPQIQTQVGEFGGAGSATPSVMRGGSSASVLDILAQIKGGGMAPSSQAPHGQTGQAQNGKAQNPQSQNGQSQAPEGQTGQAPTAAQMKSQAQSQAQANADGQADAQDAAQNAADAKAQSQNAAAQAQANAAAQAAAARTPEAISPLDRLKQTRDERASSGKRSSASDYLKRGN